MAPPVVRAAAAAFQRGATAAAAAVQRGSTSAVVHSEAAAAVQRGAAAAFVQREAAAAVQRGSTTAFVQRAAAAAVQRGATAAAAAAAVQRRATTATAQPAGGALQRRGTSTLLARLVGPLVPTARLYSTGKGRNKRNKKICKYDGEKIAEEFAKSNARLEAADRERAEITKSVKSIEEKQSKKPWFTVNFRGRQLNIPGVASLAWRVAEALGKFI